MGLLSEAEFRATMDEMQTIEDELPLPAEFWPYFDAIDPADRGGFDFGEGNISAAYRNSGDTYHHVLLASEEEPSVFLAVVLRPGEQRVHGHYLVDLPKLYGLREAP